MNTTNPIAEASPPGGILPYFTGPNESLGERIQSLAPKAHVVKAFNSVGAGKMVNPVFKQGEPTMFICGDSPEAKKGGVRNCPTVWLGTSRLRRDRRQPGD